MEGRLNRSLASSLEIVNLVDYHTHTYLCGHAVGKPVDYVEAAISANLVEIGVSDHLSLSIPEDSVPLDELHLYVDMVEEAKRLYEDRIRVRLGLEVEYSCDKIESIANILESIDDLDYTLLSIHKIGEWVINSSKSKDRYMKIDLYKLYEEYFDLVCEAASSKMFQIIAHIDLPKIFGFKPCEDMKPLYEDTARRLAKAGVCVEVNTSGLRKPVAEIYPAREFLEVLRRYNVPITLGSDAHKPEDVAYHFEDAIKEISKAGYRCISVFDKERRMEIPIF
ncbi:MAG: histidinol-phosphatase HisJ family protein [Nitrososphaerota archaeon]|nr:histidinol-phosphatase HisJ family protein [Candidatus Bathyarchaeota archaeon]MCX8161975.1 histidinol-phosphatase HisJ family protein [Candidatus Bathyarchaeota archaeon]MDW8061154.1 histidinol-phosphatase HisJ family protein [Nitrososphaerota archaeon]